MNAEKLDLPQQIGRYRILERAGRGGMGVLYRGFDPVLEREVAIKLMSSTLLGDGDESARARFYREAKASARLQHRNIVTVFEFGDEQGTPFIVMEFLRGESLAKCLGSATPLTLERKLDIVAQLCTGLHFAHEHGIVHRDVKPGNVWLVPDGTVKLLDFGIAKVGSSTVTRDGQAIGSAYYMAPEQVEGRSDVDGRADIFAAAVVLYELLAARKPFEGTSPTSVAFKILHEDPPRLDEVAPQVSPELLEIVQRGLQKNPDRRQQTAGDFGAELQLVRMALQSGNATVKGDLRYRETVDEKRDLSDTLGEARLNPPAVTPPPETGHARRPLVLAGIAAAVLVTGGVTFVVTRPAPESAPPSAVADSPADPQPLPANVFPATQTPPAPAALPAELSLQVVSNPLGATVAVNGVDSGQVTPAGITVPRGARIDLRLAKQGFRTLEASVSSEELERGRLDYSLSPVAQTSTAVTLTGDYPFEVVEGSRVLSPRAESHRLILSGQRSLRLVASSYLLNYAIRIDSSSGKSIAVQAPALGKLSVRSALETCKVSVAGRDLGFPPISNQPVAAGAYRVELKCPDGQTNRQSVTVTPGQGTLVRIP